MRKTLLSLLFAGLNVVSAFAGPLELHKAITENETTPFVRKNVAVQDNYSLNVEASINNSQSTNSIPRSLVFNFEDENTKIYISDANADGLGKDDFFTLQHKLKNGENFFLNISYSGDGNYRVHSRVESETINLADTNLDTSRLTSLLHLMVSKKIKPVLDFSQGLYNNLVESVLQGEQPKMPYDEVKVVLSGIEPYLTNARNRRNLNYGLLQLGKRYAQVVEEQSNSLACGGKK